MMMRKSHNKITDRTNMGNDGFTLVELIVVIAIMAVVMGMFIAGLGYLSGVNMRSCAHEIQTAIGASRITTMGKEETELSIYRDSSDHCYYKQEHVKESGETSFTDLPAEKIGKATLTLTYYEDPDFTATGSGTEFVDGTEIRIRFNRASGKQLSAFTGIKVASGGREMKVMMVPATGKVFLE